jgi:hypothetical protein
MAAVPARLAAARLRSLPGGVARDARPARRRRHRRPQVLADEPRDPEITLQLRHVQAAVDAVGALQLEGHMTGQRIGGGTG